MPLPCNGLRAQRLSANMSVDALARKANVAAKTIDREEDAVAKKLPGGGNIEHVEQERIAAALGISLATLRA